MSVFLSNAAVASSFSAGGAAASYLSFTANGYADAGLTLFGSSGDCDYEVHFKLPNVATNVYILGSSTSGRVPLFYSGASNQISVTGSTGTIETLGGGALSNDTWYKARFIRNGGSCLLYLYDDNDVLLKSNSSATIGIISLRYINRYLNLYGNCDIKYFRFGTPAELFQHEFVMQESGTTWFDTGTVGGWDLSLLGSPTPVWVP